MMGTSFSIQPEVPTTGYSATLVLDDGISAELIRQRQQRGVDQHDEVWEGVYVMSPLADDEHQAIVSGINSVLGFLLGLSGRAKVRPGVNVSDRKEDWTFNFRAPDVVVFLNDTAARCHGAFWQGGPDFAVEVVSEKDRTRDQLEFYSQIGTRELLIVDRQPWQLELLRLADGKLASAGTSTVEKPETLTSEVIPFTFQLQQGDARPAIVVGHTESEQSWQV